MMRLVKVLGFLFLLLFNAHLLWAQQTVEVNPEITAITSWYTDVEVSIDPKQVDLTDIKELNFELELSGKEIFYIYLHQIGQTLGWQNMQVNAVWSPILDPKGNTSGGGEVLFTLSEGDKKDPEDPVVKVTTEIDQLELISSEDSKTVETSEVPGSLEIGDIIDLELFCSTDVCLEDSLIVTIASVDYLIEVDTGEVIEIGTGGEDIEADCFLVFCDNPITKTGEVNKGNLKLYPNPASNKMLMNLEDVEATSASIYNSNGQLLDRIPIDPKSTRISYDLSHLPVGLYWLEMKTLDGIIKEQFAVIR